MKNATPLNRRLAGEISALRHAAGWSLDRLAAECGVSRATLSRLEKGETSPSLDILGQLCGAYGLSLSQLMLRAEDRFAAHVRGADAPEIVDPDTGRARRAVSPAAPGLRAEIVECHLPPDTDLVPDSPPKPAGETHLVVLDGALTVTLGGEAFDLTGGDCLRYGPSGPLRLSTGPKRGARYLLVQL